MTNTTSQPVGVYFKYGLQGSHFHYTYKIWTGFTIKDFGNDKSVVISHLMRNPGSIYSSNINKEKIGSLFGSKKIKKKINTGFPLSRE